MMLWLCSGLRLNCTETCEINKSLSLSLSEWNLPEEAASSRTHKASARWRSAGSRWALKSESHHPFCFACAQLNRICRRKQQMKARLRPFPIGVCVCAHPYPSNLLARPPPEKCCGGSISRAASELHSFSLASFSLFHLFCFLLAPDMFFLLLFHNRHSQKKVKSNKRNSHFASHAPGRCEPTPRRRAPPHLLASVCSVHAQAPWPVKVKARGAN